MELISINIDVQGHGGVLMRDLEMFTQMDN